MVGSTVPKGFPLGDWITFAPVAIEEEFLFVREAKSRLVGGVDRSESDDSDAGSKLPEVGHRGGQDHGGDQTHQDQEARDPAWLSRGFQSFRGRLDGVQRTGVEALSQLVSRREVKLGIAGGEIFGGGFDETFFG